MLYVFHMINLFLNLKIKATKCNSTKLSVKREEPLGASYQLVCSLGGLLRSGGVMGQI